MKASRRFSFAITVFIATLLAVLFANILKAKSEINVGDRVYYVGLHKGRCGTYQGQTHYCRYLYVGAANSYKLYSLDENLNVENTWDISGYPLQFILLSWETERPCSDGACNWELLRTTSKDTITKTEIYSWDPLNFPENYKLDVLSQANVQKLAGFIYDYDNDRAPEIFVYSPDIASFSKLVIFSVIAYNIPYIEKILNLSEAPFYQRIRNSGGGIHLIPFKGPYLLYTTYNTGQYAYVGILNIQNISQSTFAERDNYFTVPIIGIPDKNKILLFDLDRSNNLLLIRVYEFQYPNNYGLGQYLYTIQLNLTKYNITIYEFRNPEPLFFETDKYYYFVLYARDDPNTYTGYILVIRTTKDLQNATLSYIIPPTINIIYPENPNYVILTKVYGCYDVYIPIPFPYGNDVYILKLFTIDDSNYCTPYKITPDYYIPTKLEKLLNIKITGITYDKDNKTLLLNLTVINNITYTSKFRIEVTIKGANVTKTYGMWNVLRNQPSPTNITLKFSGVELEPGQHNITINYLIYTTECIDDEGPTVTGTYTYSLIIEKPKPSSPPTTGGAPAVEEKPKPKVQQNITPTNVTYPGTQTTIFLGIPAKYLIYIVLALLGAIAFLMIRSTRQEK